MNITIFGATGSLGSECLKQALEAGHEVTVLVRSASKLPAALREKISVVEGDALNASDVERVLGEGTEAILFAIGVDKHSPDDLCADITRHILKIMATNKGIRRLVWCGGGSTLFEEDQITLGAKFVEFVGKVFLSKRHYDKVHQYQLLQENPDIDWIGLRPLQMGRGPKRTQYRIGFDTFSGMSRISFADCAHAMLRMLNEDTWLRKAPIIQY